MSQEKLLTSSCNMFNVLGTKHQSLQKESQDFVKGLSKEQIKQLKDITTYEPKREKEKPPKHIQQYLKPLPSHRGGVFGRAASFILWKYYQALASFITPVLTKIQERLSDLRWDANNSMHHIELLSEQVILLKTQQKKDRKEIIALRKTMETLQNKKDS